MDTGVSATFQRHPASQPAASMTGPIPQRGAAIPGRVAVGSAGLTERTVQVQLSHRTFKGCTSGPASRSGKRAGPKLEALLAALPRLRAEGYQVICFSGGEALSCPWIGALLMAARAEGFRTAAVCDGFRVTARHLPLIEALDRIVINFDGSDAQHNVMRGNSRARVRAVAALRYLAGMGKPTEATLTVTRKTLADVPEFVELCAALGVRAVHLRPMMRSDRAGEPDGGLALAAADTARLWLLVQTLAKAWDGVLSVRADLVRAQDLAADADVWRSTLKGDLEQRLSDAVDPLVITPEGRLRPWTHDFPEAFDLGHLPDLDPARRIWIGLGLPRLRRLLAQSLPAAALEEGVLALSDVLRDRARRWDGHSG